MERLKLRFAETAKPSHVLVKRDDALGGVIMESRKNTKKAKRTKKESNLSEQGEMHESDEDGGGRSQSFGWLLVV